MTVGTPEVFTGKADTHEHTTPPAVPVILHLSWAQPTLDKS